jgi:hypothetical protein
VLCVGGGQHGAGGGGRGGGGGAGALQHQQQHQSYPGWVVISVADPDGIRDPVPF